MPRFVILEHDFPKRHWDLMLEADQALQTWRLAEPPALGAQIVAVPLGAHRRLYLDYEGPVSGGRGTVERWDWGTFELLEHQTECVCVRLDGQRFRGMVRIECLSNGEWQASFSACV